ncbi:MAG: glycosyltransferase [Thermoleophilaceae bacterium]|nr:glycosyltransferase [Thermoleophilaceae bacterium]
MPAAQPDLSIVVMFTHDAEQAARCLEGVSTVTSEVPRTEVILVLNQASDAVRAIVAEHAPTARVIDSPVNTGTAVGWQLAFNAARAECVLLMHEDAVAGAGMAPQLLKTLRATPRAAAVGPWIDEPSGVPSVNAGWVRFGRGNARLTPEMLPEGLADAPYAVNEISSAISLWRRSAWEEIGGFEERVFPAMGVEPDSFTGIWARGHVVLVDPQARGVHQTGAMDSAPGLLSGPHVRHFLFKEFLDVWDEKWSARADWFVGREDTGAAIARAQELRVSPPMLSDPPVSQRHLTNPGGAKPEPTELDAEMADRLRAAERGIIDDYTRWLIDRDIEMTQRYEEAHAAYVELGERVADLEERSRTLDAILGGRWWRLRESLRRSFGR